MTNDLQPKFNEALEIFIEKHKNNSNVIAILVSGSFIHSKPDKNSDLDVFVLLKNSKYRERGNTWINWVEIEYFINPVEQIRYYFKSEFWTNHTAHMFANSKILYKKNDEINQIIKEAKIIIKKRLPKINKSQLELSKYNIDDLQKDLEDVYLNKDIFSFNIIYNNILDESINIFFKFYRIPKEKSKRLQNQINSIDKAFERLYYDSLVENEITKKFEIINKLISYIENLIGWKRTKEWKLRSKCVLE